MALLGRHRAGFQLTGTVKRSKAVSVPVRPAALRKSEDTQHESAIETEVSGVGEDDDEMTEGAGDGDVDEEEMEPPDWRVTAGPEKQAHTKGERRARSNTCTIL